MNATPPEAKSEYSRGGAGSGGVSGRQTGGVKGQHTGSSTALSAALLAGGLVGALLLVAAEFTILFHVHVAATGTAVKSVSTGSHHSYAMAVIGLCAAILTIVAHRVGSRPALLGLGMLGVAALLIALVNDLPDATASGIALVSSHYVNAGSTPGTGFYLETLGAVLLVFTSVSGFLLLEPSNGAA